VVRIFAGVTDKWINGEIEMKKDDRRFICAIKVAIEQEGYDELEERYGDTWQIIERLLKIIDEVDKKEKR
jgi:hypothetical protein